MFKVGLPKKKKLREREIHDTKLTPNRGCFESNFKLMVSLRQLSVSEILH